MFRSIKRMLKKRGGSRQEIYPDEIFLDSQNLPEFDIHQFEGRIEKPISLATIVSISVIFSLLLVVLVGRAWVLQAAQGEEYARKSEANRLRQTVLFADRGAILDRRGEKLAWNAPVDTEGDFSTRVYTRESGLSHVLGYVKYPAKDKHGVYYRTHFEAIEGAEKEFDELLSGEHGLKITETDALGSVVSESTVRQARQGANVTLSIDARVSHRLYQSIKALAERVGFVGGTGALMDVHTGEIIALTSYPEYDSAVMALGADSKKISGYFSDSRKPFLDRFVTGLYTPGSIVKPYVALAALEEDVIDPKTQILSTGSISVPNPYDPTKKTVFNDWKAHGLVDMRRAIAVSSNVYFYAVGGGFQDQDGVGIDRIEKYLSMFGMAKSPQSGFFAGPAGTIPSPRWKDRVFPGDPWRVGDTYYTAIGQYGFQVTPLQMLRAVAALSNGGTLMTPSILSLASSTEASTLPADILPIQEGNLTIVREGMRLAATAGSASGLNVPYVSVAAKTGTAELGISKQFVNSWVMGFFPYESPQYAFVVLMERGPRTNLYGATYVMRELLDWMREYTPEYLDRGVEM